jgi:hypothetical protein
MMKIYCSQFWSLGSPEMKMPEDLVYAEDSLYFRVGTFRLCPHVVEDANKLPQVSFVAVLIPFTRALP